MDILPELGMLGGFLGLLAVGCIVTDYIIPRCPVISNILDRWFDSIHGQNETHLSLVVINTDDPEEIRKAG